MTFVERSANDHWSIRLLGGFGLAGPHGRVEVPPAGQRLVAYLAIQGHPVRRSTVAAGIWPDVDETRARANLRSTLSRLGALAPIIHATAASLTLAPDVAESGKREVCTPDQSATRRGLGEGAFVDVPGLRRIHVVADRDGRVLELHRGDMHDIAPQNQLFALALDHIHRVSGSVPVS